MQSMLIDAIVVHRLVYEVRDVVCSSFVLFVMVPEYSYKNSKGI